MDVLIGQLATGLSLGSILLLAALGGLSLTFGQMGVINMAHGEFIMAGCYTAYVVQQIVSSAGVSLLISLVVGFFIGGGAMGALLEVTLIQRMYARPLDTLLVTFGVGLILQQVARDIFGAPAVNVVAPPWLSGGGGDPRCGGAPRPGSSSWCSPWSAWRCSPPCSRSAQWGGASGRRAEPRSR